MKEFMAYFTAPDSYGHNVCAANTITELYEILKKRGFRYASDSFHAALEWEKTDKKKFYGMRIEITRGEPEMTEYTSL